MINILKVSFSVLLDKSHDKQIIEYEIFSFKHFGILKRSVPFPGMILYQDCLSLILR